MGRKIGEIVLGLMSLVLVVIILVALRLSGHEIEREDLLTVLAGVVVFYCYCSWKLEVWYYIITNSYKFFRRERLLKIVLFAIVSAIVIILFLGLVSAEIKPSIFFGVGIYLYLNLVHVLSGIVDDLYEDDNSNNDTWVYAQVLGGTTGLGIFLSPLPIFFIMIVIIMKLFL